MKKNKLINSLELGYVRYPKNGKKPEANSIMTGLLDYKNKKKLPFSRTLQNIYYHIIPKFDLIKDAAKPFVLLDTFVKINRNTLYVQCHIFGTK